MRIFIVSYAPSTELNGVGGFSWMTDRKVAHEIYRDEVKASAHHGGSHIVRLTSSVIPETFDVGDPRDCDEITSMIDYSLLDGAESLWPAHRQYVPACTEADRLPRARRTW